MTGLEEPSGWLHSARGLAGAHAKARGAHSHARLPMLRCWQGTGSQLLPTQPGRAGEQTLQEPLPSLKLLAGPVGTRAGKPQATRCSTALVGRQAGGRSLGSDEEMQRCSLGPAARVGRGDSHQWVTGQGSMGQASPTSTADQCSAHLGEPAKSSSWLMNAEGNLLILLVPSAMRSFKSEPTHAISTATSAILHQTS